MYWPSSDGVALSRAPFELQQGAPRVVGTASISNPCSRREVYHRGISRRYITKWSWRTSVYVAPLPRVPAPACSMTRSPSEVEGSATTARSEPTSHPRATSPAIPAALPLSAAQPSRHALDVRAGSHNTLSVFSDTHTPADHTGLVGEIACRQRLHGVGLQRLRGGPPLAEEVKDPERTIRRTVAGATRGIGALLLARASYRLFWILVLLAIVDSTIANANAVAWASPTSWSRRSCSSRPSSSCWSWGLSTSCATWPASASWRGSGAGSSTRSRTSWCRCSGPRPSCRRCSPPGREGVQLRGVEDRTRLLRRPVVGIWPLLGLLCLIYLLLRTGRGPGRCRRGRLVDELDVHE